MRPHPQIVVSYGSLLIAICFSVMMTRLVRRKLPLAPVIFLYALSGYEFYMDTWEKTVSAPIRIDLLIELPVLAGLVLWCIVATLTAWRNQKSE